MGELLANLAGIALFTIPGVALTSLFPGLRVSESFLLQNNLREILFRKPAYDVR